MDSENLKLLATLKNAAMDAIQKENISITIDDDVKVTAQGANAKWVASGMLLAVKAFEIQKGVTNNDT